jgi:hypothetical protein
MPRTKRTTDELRAASDHLRYELEMLQATAGALASGAFGDSLAGNAFLESFTIHARALLSFLYAEDPWQDDVIAEDFFASPEEWTRIRPPRTPPLEKVHGRVGKEIAHLTYGRQAVLPEMKEWSFLDIDRDVFEAAKVFIAAAPKSSLGSRWEGAAGPGSFYITIGNYTTNLY